MIGIYKIQSKCKPERFYIGSAVDIKRRWNCHKSQLRKIIHDNKKLQNHVNKYGLDDLEFSVIMECSKESLLTYEQFYIDSLNPLFNIAKIAGSQLGFKHTKETKYKISLSGKGVLRSDEFKIKLREANIGKQRISPSEETRKKISDANKGHKTSEIHKQKISLANKGLKRSDAFKKRMSSIMKVRHISNETKLKYKERSKGGNNGNARLVLSLETGIFYSCCKDAHKSYGKTIEYSYFAQMLKGTNPNKTKFIYV